MRDRSCVEPTGTRRGAFLWLAVVYLGSFVVGGPAAAADPYREVSLALGQGLVALFPAAEGYVVSASGAEVYIDLAEKDLLQPGMELQVYRPGEQLIHPVTKQVLGSNETNLGLLRLTEVREKYSRGRFEPEGAGSTTVAGDRVRVSARRLRALLHLSGAAPGVEAGPLTQALLARGAESGRFTIVDEPAWKPALAALGLALESLVEPPGLRRLGEAAAADLLLSARITAGERPAIALEVRSLRTGALLGELRERWPEAATAPAAATAVPAPGGEASAPAAPAPDGEYTVHELAAPARFLAAGDILGERRTEVLLTDGSRLSLYRWEGAALSWRWEERGRGGRRILALDAADLDGDGRVEVLVSTADRGRIASEVRSWRGGQLETVARIDGVYLRAAARPGGGSLLHGQRAGVNEVLTGRVEEYRWRADTVERVEGTALPGKAGVFGMAPAPDGGPVAFYALDRAGYLTALASDGNVLWRSARPYGGYPPPAGPRDLFGPGPEDEQGFLEEARAFQGRLLAAGVAGGVRLTVPRNFMDSPVLFVRQRGLGKGEIVILQGPPGGPEEVRSSRSFDGYVADLARADVDGDGRPEILFVVNRLSGPLLGERGKLVLWRPAGTPGDGK